MTLIRSTAAKSKPSRLSSYLSKLLRKKRSKRSYHDFSNDVIDDVESTPKKSPKKNKGKSCSSPFQPTIVLAENNSFTDLLPHNEPTETLDFHADQRLLKKSSSPLCTSTPMKKKTHHASNSHHKNLVKDLNKTFALMQTPETTKPTADCGQTNQYLSKDVVLVEPADIYAQLLAPKKDSNNPEDKPKAEERDFDQKVTAFAQHMKKRPRRSKSLTEKVNASLYIGKGSPQKPPLSVFKPYTSPRTLHADSRCRSACNINLDVTDGHESKMENGKERETSAFAVSPATPCGSKRSPRTKCTSLLNLTSRSLENHEEATVSRLIAVACSTSSKNHHHAACSGTSASTNPDSDLAKKIVKLTSVPAESEYYRRKQINSSRRPRSIIVPPVESDYVMLDPLPPSDPVEADRYDPRDPLLPRRLSLRREPDWDQSSNLSTSKSKSMCSLKPHRICRLKDESSNYCKQNNAPSYLSPGDQYRAEAIEVVAKLRRSLENVNEDNRTKVTACDPTVYNPIDQRPKRSKSVDAISARSNREPASITTERIHHPCRSRSRARHIAKKYNMLSSHDALPLARDIQSYQTQCDGDLRGNDDYVYLSQKPLTYPYLQDRPLWGNGSNANRQPTKSFNVNPSYTDYPNGSNEGRLIMTSRSSDYYHLNLIVANARPYPDGAEFRPRQTEMTPKNRTSSQGRVPAEPKIYYAIDV